MTTNSLRAVLHAEWTKLRTLQSTTWTLGLAVVISVGLGLVSGGSARHAFDSGQGAMVRPDFNPVDAGFIGLLYGQLSLVAFGILLVGAEHSTGSIRASLAAVPQRGLFYASKLAVITVVALIVSLITAFVSWPATQFGLGPYGASLSDPGALRAVLGAAAYMTLLCVFAAAVAAILRSSVLSLAVLIPFFFIIGPILAAIPGIRDVARYLPDQAGQQIMQVGQPTADTLSPTAGLMVLVGWTVATVLVGHLVLRRRDA